MIKFVFVITFSGVSFLFIGCRSKMVPDKKGIPNEVISINESKGDSILELNNFLSLNCLSSTFLSIDIDTIDFIEYSIFNKEKEYYLRKYWFDLKYQSDTSMYTFLRISNKKIYEFFANLKQKPICFNAIGKPMIKYEKISSEIEEKLLVHKVTLTGAKFHKFGNAYYFIDTSTSMTISVYNPQTDSLKKMHIENDFFDIRDFFIYDMKADGIPEIFIFSRGRRYENDAVGFDAYTVTRNDMIKK